MLRSLQSFQRRTERLRDEAIIEVTLQSETIFSLERKNDERITIISYDGNKKKGYNHYCAKDNPLSNQLIKLILT